MMLFMHIILQKKCFKKYYNYEDFDTKDFFKSGIAETFQFIGRFSNSVAISKILDLSIIK